MRRKPMWNRTVQQEDTGPHQFQFNIVEANGEINEQSTSSVEVTSQADVQPQTLDSNQLQQLLGRAHTELIAQSTDEQSYFKREATMKRPKTSKQIQTPFPPPSVDRPEDSELSLEQLKQLAKEKAGPLVIERYSPSETKIDHPLAAITITFNQPMISVATLDDDHVDVEKVGISLTPQLEGRWRWTGTRTIQYEPKQRLPYSTHYVLKVNKDQCVSAIGGKLEEGLLYEFSTATPSVLQFIPNDTVLTLKPKCYLLFDQKIHRDDILKHLHVIDSYHHEIPKAQLELIDHGKAMDEFKEQINADEGNHDRYLVFTFKEDLAKATQYTVRLPEGCPSAEGPLKTTSEWSTTFQTYEPLKIVDWSPNNKNTYQPSVDPGQSWSIRFNNSLNRSTIHRSLFVVEPEVTDLGIEHVEYDDRQIILHNNSKLNTVYTLTIRSGLLGDIHGQTLEHDHGEQPIQFHVHDAPPPTGHLSGATGMIVMDPGVLNEPYYPFTVHNYSEVTFRLHRVQPEDYRPDLPCFNAYSFSYDEEQRTIQLPGEELIQKIMQTNCERDEPQQIKIPLKEYLEQNSGVGQLLIFLEPTQKAWDACHHNHWERKPIISAWLQCTRLAVDIFVSSGRDVRLTAWVTDLMTGLSVDQATVSILNKSNETDHHGLCTIEHYKSNNNQDAYSTNEVLIVKKGDDRFLLPDIYSYTSTPNTYVWHVFNDRDLYKPKEEVHIKGYVRLLEVQGDAKLPTYAKGTIDYTVHDPRGQQLQQSKVELNTYGAFDIHFILPDNVNLGNGWVRFSLSDGGETTTHSFKIQEFRRPEYEVSSTTRSSTLHYCHPTDDEYVIATSQGKLFAGGYLSDARVQWTVHGETTTFTPAKRSDYIFGRARPFFCWFGKDNRKEIRYTAKILQGKTDNQGKHEIKISYHGIEEEPKPIMVHALAAISDLNNQTQETQTQFLIHPSTYYVGFQLTNHFGKKDQPVQTKVIVTDVDGNLMDHVSIECKIIGIGREKKEDEHGLTKFEEVKDEQCVTGVSSDQAAINIDFTPKLGGRYSWSYTVKDEQGRLAMSYYDNLYISGGSGKEIEQQKVEYITTDPLTILANKTNYQPGDQCELLVLAPFSPGSGLVILDCEGQISKPIQFQVESGKDSATVAFHISKDWIPGFTAHVELAGSIPREANVPDALPRPAIAVGSLSLEVSRDTYQLNVTVDTNEENKIYAPASTLRVHIDVTRSTDQTAVSNTEVCLIVVDEAILSLTGYQLTNAVNIFYPNRPANITHYHGRNRCLLFNMENIEEFKKTLRQQRGQNKHLTMDHACCMHSCCCADCFGCSGGGGGVPEPAIAVRSNFNPLACWVPSLTTNAAGQVSFEFKLPDNLTRYRVWAVAANDKQYGIGEMTLTVQLPIMIRPSPPRFLNYGDVAHLSVIVQNQTDLSLQLHAGLKVTNAKLLTPSSANDTSMAGYAVQLQPNKRTAITFPLSTIHAGTARFQFIVATVGNASNVSFGDAMELTVPIFTPATSEAFATHGDLGDETDVVLQPIKTPENVIPEFGALSVSISSTAVSSLTDAILALYTYPYECTEQLSSRLLGILSLWDVLKAFNTKDLPDVSVIETKLKSDLKTLEGRQHTNGGFGYWTNRSDSWADPFVSIHVAHCLVVIIKKQENLRQCNVDIGMLNRAISYLENIESEINQLFYAKHWSDTTRFSLISYALYVRAKHEQIVAKEASDLFIREGLKKLSLEALGWLLVALSTDKNTQVDDTIKRIYQHVKGQVSETSETANFITSYGDDGQSVMLHSDQRTDAILLEALLNIDPNSTLCTKLCKGLQAHRVQGAWKSTQENCFVLIALEKYFHIKEKATPDFLAHIWLENDYCGHHQYRGRTTDTHTVDIPMKVLRSEQEKNLIVHKDGHGRLYYRIGLNYAPASLQLKAANYGFKIERTYVGVEDPSHAQQQEDGTWQFVLNSKIKVLLMMTTTQRRYHIALVDYLPAGCESLNTELKGTITGETESSVTRSKRHCNFYLPGAQIGWPEHENLRDERAEAFRSLLWPGVYQWSYVMRTTCAGTFIVPPAKAEEMYSPENFGRSATEKVLIH